MAMFDTHRAVKTLTGAGFTEDQAEALINVVGERNEDLATKVDLKDEITAVRAEIAALRIELKEDIAAVRADMQALEFRMTLRLGGLVVAATVVLALLQLIP